MATTLDVTFWKAPISGFSPTITTSRTAAGWTQITGTSDLGQSATDLVIIDNGLVRVILNKNSSDAGLDFNAYGFNGSAWKQVVCTVAISGESDFRLATLQTISNNDAKQFKATIQYTARSANGTWTAEFIMSSGLPAASWRVLSVPTTPTIWSIEPVSNQAGESDVGKTFLSDTTAAVVAGDRFGYTGYISAADDRLFTVIPSVTRGFDAIIATNKDDGNIDVRTISPAQNNDLIEVGKILFVGFIPRTYALGDGGGADVGNGDGQLREAEDNPTVISGTFAIENDANCSGGKLLANSAPADGHKVTWSMNFPAAGIFYFLAPQNAGGATMTSKLTLTGATGTDNYTKTVPSDTHASEAVHLLYGPYTVPAAGNYTVALEVAAVGAATRWEIDHLSIFPYEATALSPATAIFPRDLARALLRQVTPA